MWQRARIIKMDDWPEAIGMKVWVRATSPEMHDAMDQATGEYLPPAPRYRLAIKPTSLAMVACLEADKLELLPEFGEKPDFPWSTFEEAVEEYLNETK